MSHFCVNCDVPLEARLVEGRDVEACPECGFVLWRDPKVVTMIIVQDRDGRVVVGRRSIEPAYGLWCLPGGYVNDDEHPADSAVRECREEICAEVEITELLGVYHIRRREAPSMVGIAYRARLCPGEVAVAGAEMLEVGSFPPGRLPDLAFTSHREAMRDWLRRREQSGVVNS